MDEKVPEEVSECVRVRKSPLVMVERIVVLGLVFFFVSYLGSAVFIFEEEMEKLPLLEALSFEGAFELVLIFLYVLLAGFIYLSWRATYYEICPTSVTEFRGISSRNVSEISMKRVGMVRARESFLGKRLGYGSVTVEDLDGESLMVMRDIEKPEGKKDLIMGFVEYRSGREGA